MGRADTAERWGGVWAGGVIDLARTDVGRARERFRSRRLARFALVLAGVASYLWVRIAAGEPWHPSIHLPAWLWPYLPGAALVVVLAAVLLVPALGAGHSPHVLFRPEDCDVRLSDLKGIPGAVEEAERSLRLFLDHESFAQEMGGSPRRAILFEGPPGTGKTMLAKALAAEAGVPFLFVSASAFQSMYYGQTNRKIRSYFAALRRYARAEGGAIGFIEEIDAIGAARGGMGKNSVAEGVSGVVNELLVALQSFDTPPRRLRVARYVVETVNRLLPGDVRVSLPQPEFANVLVVAATNRADQLDPALLRPGRFDRRIRFELPNRQGRREVIDFYLDRMAHSPELDDPAKREELAGLTAGYSPAMLKHMLDEALVWALRADRREMNWADITQARLTEELGLAQETAYSEAELLRIATHEAGHAVVAWLLGRRMEVASVLKRGESLGLVAHADSEERFVRTRSELLALIRIAMAGIVAEELFLGEPSNGAASDLASATSLAASMVGAYGMGARAASLVELPGPSLVAKVMAMEETRNELEQLLDEARRDARRMLSECRLQLQALRDALVAREELVGEEILEVLSSAGPRPALPEGSLVIDLREDNLERPRII